jgi:hypothetical protein
MAENRAYPSWGRMVLANNLVFYAKLKSVKIYNLFFFKFLIAAYCIFYIVVLGTFFTHMSQPLTVATERISVAS